MDRRTALKNTALLLGTVSASSVLGIMSGCKAEASGERIPLVLTRDQANLVAEMAERIIPKSDTPGAIEAGVDVFIDNMLNGYMEEEEVQTFLAGLTDVEAKAQAMHNRSFTALTPAQKDDLLRTIAIDTEALSIGERATAFFPKMKELTISGYFTSELVGENYLHYVPVPGDYVGCVDIAEVGNVNWSL